jgi:hypothetical protein
VVDGSRRGVSEQDLVLVLKSLVGADRLDNFRVKRTSDLSRWSHMGAIRADSQLLERERKMQTRTMAA